MPDVTARDRSGRGPSGLDRLASIVERLAVLLTAGVPPLAAWGYVEEAEAAPASVLRGVIQEVADGRDIPDAILRSADSATDSLDVALHRPLRSRSRDTPELSAWRGLASAWIVATEAGSPLAPALREFSSSLRSLAQARRDAATALAGPVATARLVIVLPAVGVLFGMALGFDTLGTLFATPPGLVCLALGCALLWAARVWNRRLVRKASRGDPTPGLTLDLLAIAVAGGASLDRARLAVTAAMERSGVEADLGDANAVLGLSERAGVPAGALLRSEAKRIRRDAHGVAERKAATLAVTLMMPLGLCVLPAFMLLGVAPLMIAVLSSTVGGF